MSTEKVSTTAHAKLLIHTASKPRRRLALKVAVVKCCWMCLCIAKELLEGQNRPDSRLNLVITRNVVDLRCTLEFIDPSLHTNLMIWVVRNHKQAKIQLLKPPMSDPQANRLIRQRKAQPDIKLSLDSLSTTPQSQQPSPQLEAPKPASPPGLSARLKLIMISMLDFTALKALRSTAYDRANLLCNTVN